MLRARDRRPTGVPLALAAAVCAAAFGLSACADGGTPAAAPASSDAPEFADAGAISAAVLDAVRGAGAVTVDTVGERETGEKGTGEGTVRFGDDYALDLTTGGVLPQVRLVVVDGRSYARPAQKVDGKAWVRLDDAHTENQTAALFGPLSESLRDTTDAEGMATLLGFASTLEVLPDEDIDGASYTVYKATFDKDALLAAMDDKTRAQAEQQMITASSVYTLYLDEQDRPRRVLTESTVNGIPTKQTTDYTGWGADADFEAPPADQVVSLTEASS